MYSDTQLRYLKAMGIPAWAPRTVPVLPEGDDSVAAGQKLPATPVSHAVLQEPIALATPTKAGVTKAPLDWLLCQPLRRLGDRPDPYYALGQTGSPLLVLSDASGVQEVGQPFSGAAGKLLDAMLNSIKHSRKTCQLAALAAGPVPQGDSLQAWIEQHSPRVVLFYVRSGGVVPLVRESGSTKSSTLTPGTHCIVSHHPEILLQNPDLKRPAWEDLKTALRLLA